MVRGGLIAILYEKTSEAKDVELQDRASLTLMGTDVERIITAFRSLHELWASPIEVTIAVYLLQRQLGAACVVPGIVAISKIGRIPNYGYLANCSTKFVFWP